MGAALDLLIGEQGKEALDLVDPRRGCRGEVHLPAEPFGKPVADQFGLMARRVVHEDVNVEIGGAQGLCALGWGGGVASPWARPPFARSGSRTPAVAGKKRALPRPLL